MPVFKGHETVDYVDHDNLAHIVAENINALCRLKDKKEKPKMTIAELCHVSPSAVTKWTKTPILPPVDALMIIADYFGVDLMYLLHHHGAEKLPDCTKTYSTAFIAIISLVDKGITSYEGIADPIFRYLTERYENLKNNRLSKNEFNTWLFEIVRDFDIPINLEYHNDDFIQEVIANRVDGIAAVNEDKKMRNIARALNNEEIMDKIMTNGYPDD